MFNGNSDEQIYHINYSPEIKVFGEMPNSGELTIHSHSLRLVIPREQESNSEQIKLEEKLKKRTISRGFLSSKKSIETI